MLTMSQNHKLVCGRCQHVRFYVLRVDPRKVKRRHQLLWIEGGTSQTGQLRVDEDPYVCPCDVAPPVVCLCFGLWALHVPANQSLVHRIEDDSILIGRYKGR